MIDGISNFSIANMNNNINNTPNSKTPALCRTGADRKAVSYRKGISMRTFPWLKFAGACLTACLRPHPRHFTSCLQSITAAPTEACLGARTTSLWRMWAVFSRRASARSPIRRHMARAAALALAAALLPGFTAPGHAQQVVELVSNTEKNTDGSYELRDEDSAAQAFETGSNPEGYDLDRIVLRLDQYPAAGDFSVTVALRSVADDGRPGSVLCTLSNPDGLGTGPQEFTAPATCPSPLQADSLYFVSMRFALTGSNIITDLPQWANTQSDDEDSGAAAGWAVHDTYYYRISDNANWVESDASLKIKVKGKIRAPAVPRILRVGGGPITINLDTAYPYDSGSSWSIHHYQVGDDDAVNNPGNSFVVEPYAWVGLTGNRLTVSPISAGAFEITVDPDASEEDDEQSIHVEVMSADAPMQRGEGITVGGEYNAQAQDHMEQVTLTVRDDVSKELELLDYFYDPNDVFLTYEASADKAGAGDDAVDIVTATRSGATLTIALTDKAEEGRSTNVWVTATDGAGEYARLRVIAAVSGATRPYVVTRLADRTLREDDATDTMIGGLGDGFADEDLGSPARTLVFDIAISDVSGGETTKVPEDATDEFWWVTKPMVAIVDLLDEETLTIRPREAGSATFTVTATDKGAVTSYKCPEEYTTDDDPVVSDSPCMKPGEPETVPDAQYEDSQFVSDSFTVTIVSETTPTVAQPIPAQQLDADGDAITVDLSDLNGDGAGEPAAFGDPTRGVLTYTPSSADSTVVEVGVEGSVITLTPVWRTDETSTDVTVVATNDTGEYISQSFSVTVNGATFPIVKTVIGDITLNTGDPAMVLDLRNLSGGEGADPAFLDPNARAGDELPGGLLYEMDVTAPHKSPVSTATDVITSAMRLTLDRSRATLTIFPLGYNSAEVALTATDRERKWVSQTFTVAVISGTGTEDSELPTEVSLSRNYPNPFNPQTSIDYALPRAGDASLIVYDMLGREVDVLIDGPQAAGRHTVRFGANDLPNGVYVYRLVAGEKTIARTMVLVK